MSIVYGIVAGENGRCEIRRGLGECVAVIPDASPLMPGDQLRIEMVGAWWRFFVNDLCVWQLVDEGCPPQGRLFMEGPFRYPMFAEPRWTETERG